MNTKIQKTIVYIDGYNLYYGIREKFKGKYKWLDLQALAQSFLQNNMALQKVKYFTALAKGEVALKQRQEIYLKALKKQCDKLEFYYGRFLKKKRKCRNCECIYFLDEEKKTDVNIACQILNDVHQNHFDCCYIVSGDSDLVPPVEIVKKYYPDKKIIVVHPPERKSKELCKVADAWFAIGKNRLKQNQLPLQIETEKNIITKPSYWN